MPSDFQKFLERNPNVTLGNRNKVYRQDQKFGTPGHTMKHALRWSPFGWLANLLAPSELGNPEAGYPNGEYPISTEKPLSKYDTTKMIHYLEGGEPPSPDFRKYPFPDLRVPEDH